VLQRDTEAVGLLEAQIAVMAAPTLTFWERNAPVAAVAVAKFCNVSITATADPKGTKDTVAALKLPTG
jgi:hypothetical protein